MIFIYTHKGREDDPALELGWLKSDVDSVASLAEGFPDSIFFEAELAPPDRSRSILQERPYRVGHARSILRGLRKAHARSRLGRS